MTYDAWKTRSPDDEAERYRDDDGDDPRCTCRMETVNSASIDPPEPILDPYCPVHGGKDPDAEYERQRDDAAWDKQYGSNDWAED